MLCRVASDERHESRLAPQRVQCELPREVQLEVQMTRPREPLENGERSITLTCLGVHPREVDRLVMTGMQRVGVSDRMTAQRVHRAPVVTSPGDDCQPRPPPYALRPLPQVYQGSEIVLCVRDVILLDQHETARLTRQDVCRIASRGTVGPNARCVGLTQPHVVERKEGEGLRIRWPDGDGASERNPRAVVLEVVLEIGPQVVPGIRRVGIGRGGARELPLGVWSAR
jgi:hypothetical protein